MNRGGIRGRSLGRRGSQAVGTQAEYMYPPPHYRGGGRGRGLLYNRPPPLNNEGQYWDSVQPSDESITFASWNINGWTNANCEYN